MRHVEKSDLWLQKEVADGRLKVNKIWGTENPADLMTKYLAQEVIDRHCAKLNLRFEDGRAELAPHLASIYVSKAYWELEEEESDEGHNDYGDWGQLQSVANKVWHDKWKQAVKNSIKANGGIEPSIGSGEDAMPPLVPLPQTNIRYYAVQKGLLKQGVIKKRGRRGPTRGSEIPTPTWGIL